MHHSIAIIGPEAEVSLFRATGAEVISLAHIDTESVTTAVQKILECTDTPYGIIFMTESVYAHIPEEVLRKFHLRDVPVLSVLPSINGSSARAMDRIRTLAKRAIGSDLL